MGRNTFPIYVVHVIVLVGGLFGIGLKPHLLHHNLGPWATVLTSLAFILSFALMTYFIEPLDKAYSTILSYLLPWKWNQRKSKEQKIEI
jgi:peptidoglycan/LPS O-acetylase OafA/YrhL